MPDIRFTLDPNNPPRLTPEQEARMAAMTEAEIEANALADPDCPLLTPDQLDRLSAARIARDARSHAGLSQDQFAARFRVPVDTLRDWEGGCRAPDAPALAYLRVILHRPEAVEEALALG